MTLPPLPKDRNWSPETRRAGLDEAVRLSGYKSSWNWHVCSIAEMDCITAHATTLLDAGIVKPVVSEGRALLCAAYVAYVETPDFDGIHKCPAAIAVIDAALAKARSGQ